MPPSWKQRGSRFWRKWKRGLQLETAEVAQVAAKQLMAELQPWIEREKAEHIRRVVP